jgi:hypothetical protein
MMSQESTVRGYPPGVWAAIVAVLLQLVAWGTQAFAIIDWNAAVDAGLQSDRFTGDAVERTWAAADWGIAAADMVWPLPVAVVALVGLLRKRSYGYAAGLMQLSIGVYWPLVFAFQRWTTDRGVILMALAVWALTSLIGLVGLWWNRRLFCSDREST